MLDGASEALVANPGLALYRLWAETETEDFPYNRMELKMWKDELEANFPLIPPVRQPSIYNSTNGERKSSITKWIYRKIPHTKSYVFRLLKAIIDEFLWPLTSLASPWHILNIICNFISNTAVFNSINYMLFHVLFLAYSIRITMVYYLCRLYGLKDKNTEWDAF